MINLEPNSFEKDGIVKVKNFLTANELYEIKNIVKFYSFHKNHPESVFSTKIRHLIYKLLKFKFKKFNHHLKILKLAKRKKLNNIANNLFGKESFLDSIDGYYSPVSNLDVLSWHTDQAYSGNKKITEDFVNPDHYYIKFFIYLTSVGSNNGCMSYIPGSHKITYLLRKGIYQKILEYEPYWALKDLRNFILKKNNYEYLKVELKDKNLIDDFLNKIKFIENKSDSSIYDYSMSAGDAIIFDEGGVHKGSKTSINERLVLRYMFRTKN